MWKVLDKLGVLFVNFFSGLKFAVCDYDAKLKVNKTIKQRVMIWGSVVVITFTALGLFLLVLGTITKSLLNKF